MKKNQNQFRQGDVLITRVSKIPSTAKRVNEAPILAHGEVTGHCHEIEQHADAEVFHDTDTYGASVKFMRLKRDTGVVHRDLNSGNLSGDHGSIPLKKGRIHYRRQDEYTPQGIRQVAD